MDKRTIRQPRRNARCRTQSKLATSGESFKPGNCSKEPEQAVSSSASRPIPSSKSAAPPSTAATRGCIRGAEAPRHTLRRAGRAPAGAGLPPGSLSLPSAHVFLLPAARAPLGDYLAHSSPVTRGSIVAVWVAAAQIVNATESGYPEFDLSASPANELFRVVNETWPDETVSLLLEDPVFSTGRVPLNASGEILVGAPKEQFDAIILFPLVQRDFLGDWDPGVIPHGHSQVPCSQLPNRQACFALSQHKAPGRSCSGSLSNQLTLPRFTAPRSHRRTRCGSLPAGPG